MAPLDHKFEIGVLANRSRDTDGLFGVLDEIVFESLGFGIAIDLGEIGFV